MRSCLFLFERFLGFDCWKNLGASSNSHLGSMAMTSRMYSFVVKTSSW